MNKHSIYPIAAIVLPMICLFFAVGVVFFQWHRLQQARADQAQTEAQLAMLNKSLKEMTARPNDVKVPTAAATPQEQPLFLNQLRGFALLSHVQLTRWSNVAPATPAAAPPAGSGTATGTLVPGLPSGVTPIASTVEIVGQYGDLRRFLYSLQRTPRLLNLSAIKWSRENMWPQTRLSFTLTRYVAAPNSAMMASTPTGGSS